MNGKPLNAKRRHAINFAVFVALVIATLFELWSPWGLLFIFWIIPNFYSGRAFLVFEVARDEAPVLFWLVQLTWFALGVMMVLMDFVPGWA